MNHQELAALLQPLDTRQPPVSKLGFFSQPYLRTLPDGTPVIVKVYKPFRNEKAARTLVAHHDRYVETLRNLDLRLPDTRIFLYPTPNRRSFQPVILQTPFEPVELVRNLMETAEINDFLKILDLILTDVLGFWQRKPPHLTIGFHPTLRNYALRNDQLFYFDTFPPMLLPQPQLNRLILQSSPVRFVPAALVPSGWVNLISDEYFQLDKMFIGIVGSACRLRPEFSTPILNFCSDFFRKTDFFKPEEQKKLLQFTSEPPNLPAVWVFFRKLFKKEGKPNIGKK